MEETKVEVTEEVTEEVVQEETTEEAKAFKPINSQEELDSIFKKRLEREKKKNAEATAGLQTELETLKASNKELSSKGKEYEGLTKEVEELRAKVKDYETNSVKMRIAKELGIPEEMANRLRGDNEEDIRKDAMEFYSALPKTTAPQRRTEVMTSEDDGITTVNDKSALRSLLQEMNASK